MLIPKYPTPEKLAIEKAETGQTSKKYPNWRTDDAECAALCEELFPAPVKGRLIPEDDPCKD